MTKAIYACNAKDQAKMIFDLGKRDILMSYYYLNQKTKLIDLLEFIHPQVGTFILDSGAYSAWRSGKKVILYDYIDFVKKYHKYFTDIVCLDVIDNPIYSEVNHLIMLKELSDYDLEIMPVFHAGEPFSVLDYMVEKGYKYIGISPNNNWFEQAKRNWLDKVFSRYNFDKLGIKTHGFGYQSLQGCQLYPLSTTDAATWNLASGYGRILDETYQAIYSDESRHYLGHIDNLPGGDSEFTKELLEYLSLTQDDLRTDYISRRKFNIEATDRIINPDKKSELSVEVDLFADVDSSFGYLEVEFSEDEVKKVFDKVIKLNRAYEGIPL